MPIVYTKLFDLLKEKAIKLAEKVKDEWFPTLENRLQQQMLRWVQAAWPTTGDPLSYPSPGWSCSTPDPGATSK